MMPLPSQGARSTSRRSHMYRRARKPRRGPRLVQLGGAVAVVALAWWFWPTAWFESDGPQDGLARGSIAGATGAAAETEAGTADEVGFPPEAPAAHHKTEPIGPIVLSDLVAGVPARLDDDRERAAASPPQTRTPDDAVVMGEITPVPPARTPSRQAAAPAIESPIPARTAADGARGSSRASSRMAAGLDLVRRNRPLEARRVLSDLLGTGELTPMEAQQARDSLAQLNERLIFSPHIEPGDPFVLTYEIASGDALSRIARRRGVQTEWQFIQRINGIRDPQLIRVGQHIKLVTGPFHAVVTKSAFRMDLYMGEWSDRIYVRSFPVGLGAPDRETPTGGFTVKNSKQINPQWTHPETRKLYAADDPQNPIGERWIGVEADDPSHRGYGIHGTIDPSSIGRRASMGCVRMRAADVELVYEVLMPGVSRVEIVP